MLFSYGLDRNHIQPWRTRNTALPDRLLRIVYHPLLLFQTDANIGAHQPFHPVSGIGCDQSPLYIADGDGQIRTNHPCAFTGIPIHAAVDIHTDHIGSFALACILQEAGHPCTVFTVSQRMSQDGAFYAEKAKTAGVPVVPFETGCLGGVDMVVDCLLGTAANRP